MTAMEEDKPTSKEEDKTTTPSKIKKPTMGQPSASEESASKYPDMELCQKIHRLTTKQTNALSKEQQQTVFDTIANELENPSLYRHVVDILKPMDLELLPESKLKEIDTKNTSTLEELEQKVEEAKESAGDMEVMDARVEVARFAAKSLSEKDALEAYGKLIDLPKISSGKKIDALMETSRVASFYGDTKKSDEYIEKVCASIFIVFLFFSPVLATSFVMLTTLRLFSFLFIYIIISIFFFSLFFCRLTNWLRKDLVVIGIVVIVSRFIVLYLIYWPVILKVLLVF